MSTFERFAPLKQGLQLGTQFQPLFLQALKFRNLLLKRRAHSSLLACHLIERCQPRQLVGMTRVGLGDALAGPGQCTLGLRIPGIDPGKMFLNWSQRRCKLIVESARGVRVRRLLLDSGGYIESLLTAHQSLLTCLL